MHLIKHFLTITKHRNKVMKYCFKCGLYKQGLLHDLSKYSFVEFFNGAKYYQGTYSPNHNERKERGYSLAWMHHKGRNKHHFEYWVDVNLKTNKYEPVDVPKKYIVESVCDRIAASKVYRGKEFMPVDVYNYFKKEINQLPISEYTKCEMEHLLSYYIDNGEKKLFKYIKKDYLVKAKKELKESKKKLNK